MGFSGGDLNKNSPFNTGYFVEAVHSTGMNPFSSTLLPVDPDAPITVVGGGPVGLLLACLLGQQGRELRVIEKRTRLPESSMAIGITPPSLDILEQLGLKQDFVARGVLIKHARVFENGRPVGQLHFRNPENNILSLPQSETLRLLRQKLSTFPAVQYEEGRAFSAQDAHAARGWLIACDGARSALRAFAGIRGKAHGYGVNFIMADFPDNELLGSDARLYFSADGAVESFPLPGQVRRWIVQVDGAADLTTLRQRVKQAANIDLHGRDSGPLSAFSPRWFLAQHYHKGKVILCGDAAHVMSPIGGQGMNTGFADGMMLAKWFRRPTAAGLADYTRQRQRAFRIASRRAAMGMWLGTRRGPWASTLRQQTLRALLGMAVSEQTLARTFCMRNLPHPCNP